MIDPNVDPEQIAICMAWLKTKRKSKTLNPRSTYALKHDAEDDVNAYVSECAFIRAAELLGFTVERTQDGAHINLRD